MLAWLKDRAAADCRSVSSFVVKCIAEQQRFDNDDEIAAELQRELIAL